MRVLPDSAEPGEEEHGLNLAGGVSLLSLSASVRRAVTRSAQSRHRKRTADPHQAVLHCLPALRCCLIRARTPAEPTPFAPPSPGCLRASPCTAACRSASTSSSSARSGLSRSCARADAGEPLRPRSREALHQAESKYAVALLLGSLFETFLVPRADSPTRRSSTSPA
jgi:hypothetical protein